MRRKSFSETVGDVKGKTLEKTLHNGLVQLQAEKQTTQCAIWQLRQ